MYGKGGERVIVGLTDCGTRTMQINNVDPGVSSFPHEIVHAMQNCRTGQESTRKEDYQHEGWFDAGIVAGIDIVRMHYAEEMFFNAQEAYRKDAGL